MVIRTVFIALLFLMTVPVNTYAYDHAYDHNHTMWNELLQAHVIDHQKYSQVDYKGIKKEEQKLNRYLASISSLSKTEFNNWDREQQLAFLINAYNAFTVKLILKHYPVKSIKDIGSFFTSSWKIKFFELFGQTSYLDYIEHDLIRGNPTFNEPRIHFALVCASVGCPKLHNQAFTAANLEILLESGARFFLEDNSRNQFNPEQGLLKLSKIFYWYGEDFEKKFGSTLKFVSKYITRSPAKQALIAQHKVKVEYLDYNWSLNDVMQ